MISFRARIARYFVRFLFNSVDGDAEVDVLRPRFERFARRLKPVRGTRIETEVLGGVPCEWVTPPGVSPDAPVLYYLHGGAYSMGSSATHRQMVSYLAVKAGMRALVPNYRLAPEHPFPAGLDDCMAAWDALCEQVYPGRVAIGGDSAGGGMTMALLLRLRDAGRQLPGAAVLFSPWLDLTASGESATTRAEADPMFDAEHMPTASRHYAPESMWRDPLVSPVFGEHHGLPPLFVQVGDHEILLSDSTRLADSVNRAGGQVTLQVWPQLWHVFQYLLGRMPEARKALREAAEFLKNTVGVDAAARSDRAA